MDEIKNKFCFFVSILKLEKMKKILLCFFLITLLFKEIHAQNNLDYQMPDPAILDLADVTLPPSIFTDEKAENAFMVYKDRYKSISELSNKELKLAGLRINPQTNIGSRTKYYFKITYYNLKTAVESEINNLPKNGKFSMFTWSPDQSKLAFTNTTNKGVELWVIDVKNRQAKKLTSDNLNANLGRPFSWYSDNNALLIKVLPKDRKALIENQTSIPTGPIISESVGKLAQNRTYQDLLKSKNDVFNFEQLVYSEIKKITLNGNITDWAPKAMYGGMSFSPDGNYVVIVEIKKPFSYIVPYSRFPFTETVFDRSGKKIKQILEAQLEEDRPKGFMSVRKGIRNIKWRPDKPATLYWIEALDGGDSQKKAAFRDEVYQLDAPFNTNKKFLLKTIDRFAGIDWGTDNLAVAYDYWWTNRNTSRYLFNPSKPQQEPKRFYSKNYQDKYNEPGTFLTKRNQWGRQQLAVSKNKLFLIGDGYSKEGILPFIDEFSIKQLKSKRLWRASKGDKLEQIVDVINLKKGIVLERIESKNDYPNYFFRNIYSKHAKPEQKTFFKNPFEVLKNIHKEVIKYKRADGVELSATLYLPPNYNRKEKLPMLMWAYPREFKDNLTAGQITSSPNEFTYPWYGSPIFWVMRGYAVLDDASFPIIGEGDKEPNDTFIPQLVEDAKAAIDAVDKLGYINRNRVAVGGHSYGAFMVANLLTHSDLFTAGIARSGAYNRTLTPFGFQSEERNYWETPEVYNTMSPFQNANKMKHPLLLIHGGEDNNSGTYTMQSKRYFNALKGLGAISRLVILPKEAHGYKAKESVMHMLWEQDQWLEKYVKNKKMN